MEQVSNKYNLIIERPICIEDLLKKLRRTTMRPNKFLGLLRQHGYSVEYISNNAVKITNPFSGKSVKMSPYGELNKGYLGNAIKTLKRI